MSHHPRTEGETDIKLMKLKIDYNLYTKGEPDPVTPGCKGRSDSLKKEKKRALFNQHGGKIVDCSITGDS